MLFAHFFPFLFLFIGPNLVTPSGGRALQRWQNPKMSIGCWATCFTACRKLNSLNFFTFFFFYNFHLFGQFKSKAVSKVNQPLAFYVRLSLHLHRVHVCFSCATLFYCHGNTCCEHLLVWKVQNCECTMQFQRRMESVCTVAVRVRQGVRVRCVCCRLLILLWKRSSTEADNWHLISRNLLIVPRSPSKLFFPHLNTWFEQRETC